MQRMSRSPDQWQLDAHRLHSLNYVTTRTVGQESLQSRARSSTVVDMEIVFFSKKGDFFIWTKFKWLFLTTRTVFFFVQCISPFKKVQKGKNHKTIFCERCWPGNSERWKHQKKQNRKRRKNTKIKNKQLKIEKISHPKIKEIEKKIKRISKEVFFLKKTFLKEIHVKINFQMKKHKKQIK